MRTLAANHTTENNKLQNKPVVEVQFTGITNRYSSETFSSISANHKKYINNFNITWPKLSLTDGVQSVTTIDFTLTDKSQTVTSDLNGTSFFEIVLTARIGDQEIAIGDFFDLPTVKLRGDLSLGRDLRSWGFSGTNVFELLKGDIFRTIPTTNLDADYLKGVTTTMGGVSFAAFIDATALPSKIGAQAYLKVDSEIIKYEAFTSTEPSTITRGMFGTKDTDHFDGARVEQFFAFTGVSPTDWLLYILLTGGGHAFYDLSTFDTAFNDFGLGLTSAEVNITNIERLGYKMFDEIEYCHFLGSFKKQTAKPWLIENILRPSDTFIFSDSSNKIDVGIIDVHELANFRDTGSTILTGEVIETLDYRVDMSTLVNELHYRHAIEPITEQPGTTDKIEYDDSKTTHGAQDVPTLITSPLLGGSSLSDDKIAWLAGRRRLLYYGNPLATAKIEVDPRRWLFENYDTVTIANDNIPDLENTGLGVSNKWVVVGHSLTPIGSRRNTYDMISHEPYNLNASFPATAFTEVEEVSITDTTVTFLSPADLVQNAEDGNHNFGGDITAGLVFWDVKITPPNSGTTEHWISLRMKYFTSAPVFTGTVADRAGICRYNSGDSTAFVVRLLDVVDSATIGTPSVSMRSMYLQWYDASASGGGGERPTVALIGVGYLSLPAASFSIV